MGNRTFIRLDAVVVAIAGGLAVGGWLAPAWGADAPKPLPSFKQVRELVERHFAMLPDRQSDDLLAQSEVEPLFPQLKRLGWTVADRNEILQQVPADNDFLNRKLRTPAGSDFMRHVAAYPGGYDRLDRLSRLPQGRQTVDDLIRTPGGYKMIEYLATSSGGAAMGTMLSKAPHGADFNKPTGRIYTATMLLERLKQSHAAAEKAAAAATGT